MASEQREVAVGRRGSIGWFRDNVRRLRPEQQRIDPADRLMWAAGDAAQCDLWFPPEKIPFEDGTAKLLPVLVITPAHSRFMTAKMIPTRNTEDLLLGSYKLVLLPPRDPESKGFVDRRNDWFETSFMPGRSFTSPADFTEQ